MTDDDWQAGLRHRFQDAFGGLEPDSGPVRDPNHDPVAAARRSGARRGRRRALGRATIGGGTVTALTVLGLMAGARHDAETSIRGDVAGAPMWLLWLGFAAALAIPEMLFSGFVLAMLAGAAVVAAVAAGLGVPLAVQLVVFAVASVALLAVVRPITSSRFVRTPPSHLTGALALVGQVALVTDAVDAHGGRVRVQGEEWSAQTGDPDQVCPAGASVLIVDIRGATALVLPTDATAT